VLSLAATMEVSSVAEASSFQLLELRWGCRQSIPSNMWPSCAAVMAITPSATWPGCSRRSETPCQGIHILWANYRWLRGHETTDS
jgi:hypothetical protein